MNEPPINAILAASNTAVITSEDRRWGWLRTVQEIGDFVPLSEALALGTSGTWERARLQSAMKNVFPHALCDLRKIENISPPGRFPFFRM